MSKKGKIKLEAIKAHQKKFDASPRLRQARNSLTRTKLKDAALDYSTVSTISHDYSHVITKELKVTNQKQSGRCWIFAALNVFRLEIANKYKLDNFELSQNHLYFWDKFEKANFFLENIIETIEQPVDSRLMMHLLSKPLDDGGQWSMIVSLIKKYGLVPQSVCPDTSGCTSSAEINTTIIQKLREGAAILRKNRKKKPAELRKMKEVMMEEVYRMLVIHLGNPVWEFDWTFKDKNKKVTSFKKLTPHSFCKKHVNVNLDDYVILIDSPRRNTPYYRSYTVEYLGNVVEGDKVFYVNVPIDVIKTMCIKTLKDKKPVWFGCDVGKYLHRDLGIMDTNLFDYDLLYDVEFLSTKAERMDFGASMMTHAMVFTGVNLVNNVPDRWRVENSWNDTSGDKGYYGMSDDWFDEYMFEVAIEKKYLPKKVLDLLDMEPISLPAWDPMGSLAR